MLHRSILRTSLIYCLWELKSCKLLGCVLAEIIKSLYTMPILGPFLQLFLPHWIVMDVRPAICRRMWQYSLTCLQDWPIIEPSACSLTYSESTNMCIMYKSCCWFSLLGEELVLTFGMTVAAEQYILRTVLWCAHATTSHTLLFSSVLTRYVWVHIIIIYVLKETSCNQPADSPNTKTNSTSSRTSTCVHFTGVPAGYHSHICTSKVSQSVSIIYKYFVAW